MKEKGFTLIELLAVIVVLAIIALIATPMVLNTIDKARVGAAESSALSYASSLEIAIATSMVYGDKLITGLYTLGTNGNIATPVTIIVNVKGDKATEGHVCVTAEGSVGAYSLKVGNYYITSLDGTTQEVTDGIQELDCASSTPSGLLAAGLTKGTEVYLNPETKTLCESTEAVSTTGTKTGCMKWYVYKDNGNGTHQLILDHNTTALTTWSTTSSNNTNADAAVTQLTTDTTSWNASLSSRLITADEVAEITGNTTFSGATSTWDKYFYFDTNTASIDTTISLTKKSKYAWLFDNTNGCTGGSTEYGCNVADSSNYGYWTSTLVSGTTRHAWRVDRHGSMRDNYVDNTNNYGVRPIITV